MYLKPTTDSKTGRTTVEFTDGQRMKLADLKSMFKQIVLADEGAAGYHAATVCGAIENILTGAPVDPDEDVPDGGEEDDLK